MTDDKGYDRDKQKIGLSGDRSAGKPSTRADKPCASFAGVQGETVPLSVFLRPFQIFYDLISARKAHAKIWTVLQSMLFTGFNLQFPTLSKLRKYEFVHQWGYKIFKVML